MGQVVLNVNRLTFRKQIAKGANVIAQSTNNPNVPGNADELAAFVAAQAAFEAANAEWEAARTTAKAKTAARKAALAVWKRKLRALAAKTESVAGGTPAGVLSTGLELRSAASPTQPLAAPVDLHVATNGRPGMSKLSWTLAGAASFLVQSCVDPITPDGWKRIATPTKASCTVNGAEPGKKRWYRVAGVNARGQGPWSDPAARPVM